MLYIPGDIDDFLLRWEVSEIPRAYLDYVWSIAERWGERRGQY
jgi:hypothetical protein